MEQPTALVPTQNAHLAALLEVSERARDYVRAAKAERTQRAYRVDWQDFASWCEGHGLTALPAAPETVALYLADLAGKRKASTLSRRLVSISQAHKAAGHDSPTASALVRTTWAGIKRTHGTARQGKAPAVTEDIRVMVATLGDTLIGKRDRGLLLMGFAGAFRRGELVALDVADVDLTREGLVVTLRRSKTDQEGQGTKKGIPYGSNPATCPVRALRAWLEASGVAAGPLFRPVAKGGRLQATRLTDKAVALVVKRTAKAAGLDPARYSGHSLRSGLATAAALAGVPERVIMDQTGHKSLPMLRTYIRNGNLFRENAAASVGL